ncbi:MAG: hypothetical protein WA828_17700, partial [Coleofasciculaceae cyanobacterium]
PQKVAQNMNFEPTIPIIMVMGYNNFQDVALGLSFALAIEQKQESNNHTNTEPNFAFLDRKLGYETVWDNLSNLAILPTSRLNLWVVAPGLKQRDYPPKLMLKNKTRCLLDSTKYYRIGIPYQLYRCASAPKL